MCAVYDGGTVQYTNAFQPSDFYGAVSIIHTSNMEATSHTHTHIQFVMLSINSAYAKLAFLLFASNLIVHINLIRGYTLANKFIIQFDMATKRHFVSLHSR